MHDINQITRTLARTIDNAEDTIRSNARRMIDDLERTIKGIDEGLRVSEMHAQRRDDLNRAITARQAAWDTVVMLDLEDEINAKLVEYRAR